jgi:hypothetical protein
MRRQVLLLILLAACKRDERGPAAGGGEAAPAGPAHRVEVAPPAACKAGADCTVELRLTALGDFHVNQDYPFKFVPSKDDGVTPAEGAFARDGDKAGTMTVTFRPAAAGTAKVAGTFKLSVCNDDECKIEEEPVAVDVVVES